MLLVPLCDGAKNCRAARFTGVKVWPVNDIPIGLSFKGRGTGHATPSMATTTRGLHGVFCENQENV